MEAIRSIFNPAKDFGLSEEEVQAAVAAELERQPANASSAEILNGVHGTLAARIVGGQR